MARQLAKPAPRIEERSLPTVHRPQRWTSGFLTALLAAFCGILFQLTRILPGTPRITRTSDAGLLDGFPAMGLMLGALAIFSVWLPAPLLQVMEQARDIIGGKQ